MTPQELDDYLCVARKHGGTRLKVGDVEVDLGPQRAEPAQAASPEAPAKSPEEHWERVERDLFVGAPT